MYKLTPPGPCPAGRLQLVLPHYMDEEEFGLASPSVTIQLGSDVGPRVLLDARLGHRTKVPVAVTLPQASGIFGAVRHPGRAASLALGPAHEGARTSKLVVRRTARQRDTRPAGSSIRVADPYGVALMASTRETVRGDAAEPGAGGAGRAGVGRLTWSRPIITFFASASIDLGGRSSNFMLGEAQAAGRRAGSAQACGCWTKRIDANDGIEADHAATRCCGDPGAPRTRPLQHQLPARSQVAGSADEEGRFRPRRVHRARAVGDPPRPRSALRGG